LGTIQLTNVFSKTKGDGKKSQQFHAAADGKGATFSVFKGRSTGAPVSANELFGGYDPVSWDSIGAHYNVDPTNAGRTAFLFNLTTVERMNQKLQPQLCPIA